MQLDRKDLKTQALLERVTTLTTEYESKVADLRVELTMVSEQLREAQQTIADLRAPDETVKADSDNKFDWDEDVPTEDSE